MISLIIPVDGSVAYTRFWGFTKETIQLVHYQSYTRKTTQTQPPDSSTLELCSEHTLFYPYVGIFFRDTYSIA